MDDSPIIPTDDAAVLDGNATLPDYLPQWSRPVRFIALVFLIIAGIYAFTLMAPVSVLITLTFLFTFIMYKPARFFYRRTPLPWSLGVLISYLIMVTIMIVAILFIVPRISVEFNNLLRNVQGVVRDLQVYASEYEPEDGIHEVFGFEVDLNFVLEPIMQLLRQTAPSDVINPEGTGASGEDAAGESAANTDPPTDEADDEPIAPLLEVPAQTGTNERTVITLDGQVLNQEFINSLIGLVGTVTTAITSLIGSVLNLFVTVLLSLFLSLLVLFDFRNTRKAVVMRISASYHREVAVLLKKIVDIWNGFLKGQVMLAMLVGVVTYLQLMLMGVQGALLMALVTAVISIIPTIGGIIALIPMFFVPLLTGSTVFTELSPVTFALLVVVVNLIITQIIWNAVAPAIMGDALNLPMVVIILGVFVGAAVGGVLGAFLVAPVVSMLRIIAEYFIAKIAGNDPFPQEEGEIASQWEIERIRMRDQMKQERRRKQQQQASS